MICSGKDQGLVLIIHLFLGRRVYALGPIKSPNFDCCFV